MRLARLIVAVHRDLGYFLVGLTLIYAISGVCVNHIDAWNPNYTKRTKQVELGRLAPTAPRAELARQVLARMNITETPRSSVRMSPEQLKVFLENRTLTVAIPEGTTLDEQIAPRPVLYEMNYLHLNHGKGIWTWLADFYAVGLGLLALSGVFIVRGQKGLGGRGRWFVAAGVALPVVYLAIKLS